MVGIYRQNHQFAIYEGLKCKKSQLKVLLRFSTMIVALISLKNINFNTYETHFYNIFPNKNTKHYKAYKYEYSI